MINPKNLSFKCPRMIKPGRKEGIPNAQGSQRNLSSAMKTIFNIQFCNNLLQRIFRNIFNIECIDSRANISPQRCAQYLQETSTYNFLERSVLVFKRGWMGKVQKSGRDSSTTYFIFFCFDWWVGGSDKSETCII